MGDLSFTPFCRKQAKPSLCQFFCHADKFTSFCRANKDFINVHERIMRRSYMYIFTVTHMYIICPVVLLFLKCISDHLCPKDILLIWKGHSDILKVHCTNIQKEGTSKDGPQLIFCATWPRRPDGYTIAFQFWTTNRFWYRFDVRNWNIIVVTSWPAWPSCAQNQLRTIAYILKFPKYY